MGDERSAILIGAEIYGKYGRWPVYSKFFDNMGPIPHHMHQSAEDAALVGQEGKPEAYYFPPQYNNVDNHFAYTFMGLEPEQRLRKFAAAWRTGIAGITVFWIFPERIACSGVPAG